MPRPVGSTGRDLVRAHPGIGSNIDPYRTVIEAVRRLAGMEGVEVVAASTFHLTAPVLRKDQPRFLNGVLLVETVWSAIQLKADVLRPLEEDMGRVRSDDPHAERTIDLDVCLYGDQVIDAEELQIPDPDIFRRPFLAIPIRELSPDLELPGGPTIGSVAASMDASGLDPQHEFTDQLKKIIRLDHVSRR